MIDRGSLQAGASCLSIVTGACLLLSACATPNYPQAEQARADVAKARTDPQVERHAAMQLQQAETALSRMEEAVDDGETRPEIEHLAYLASRQAALAQSHATATASWDAIDDLDDERNQILLAAEERRATAAEREADAASTRADAALGEAQAERQRAERLEASMANLQAERTSRGMVLTLNDVLFEVGKSDLTAGGLERIQEIANALKESPAASVAIEGHTDNTGTEAFNQQLSADRARAVREAIVADGVDADRISARGLGESYPLAPNDTEAGRQQNRRVEVIVRELRGATG